MIKNIKTNSASYPICINQSWLIAESMPVWKQCVEGKRLMVVTNQTIEPLYLKAMLKLLNQCGAKKVYHLVVSDGEIYKNLDILQLILNTLFSHQFDRSCVLVALGGGVIGDTVGFAASIYQRGIDYIQVPTTLLSQVDSSVGGKTAINFSGAKNSVGTFFHPSAVFIATDVLSTLPDREYVAGWAEVIKYAMIRSSSFFEYLLSHVDSINRRDQAILFHAIDESIEAKTCIVAADEFEQEGQRQLLNFGHTFAHVIESFYHYKRYLHGEAVAIGMMMAIRLSHDMGKNVTANDIERTSKLLQAIGLPVRLDDLIPSADFWRLLRFDKKMKEGALNMILLRGIGDAYVDSQVSQNFINDVIGLSDYEK